MWQGPEGSGCFKALNTPVTLTIQPTFVVSLFTLYCMFFCFFLDRFYFDKGRKKQQHFERWSFWKSEGLVIGNVGTDVPWDHKDTGDCDRDRRRFRLVDDEREKIVAAKAVRIWIWMDVSMWAWAASRSKNQWWREIGKHFECLGSLKRNSKEGAFISQSCCRIV